MANFFFNSKNPISTYFWPISPIFGSKSFQKKSGSAVHKGWYSNIKFQRNLMIQFQENIPIDSRIKRWTDPFHSTFWLLLGVQQTQLQ